MKVIKLAGSDKFALSNFVQISLELIDNLAGNEYAKILSKSEFKGNLEDIFKELGKAKISKLNI